jgi:hypothetical protein
VRAARAARRPWAAAPPAHLPRREPPPQRLELRHEVRPPVLQQRARRVVSHLPLRPDVGVQPAALPCQRQQAAQGEKQPVEPLLRVKLSRHHARAERVVEKERRVLPGHVAAAGQEAERGGDDVAGDGRRQRAGALEGEGEGGEAEEREGEAGAGVLVPAGCGDGGAGAWAVGGLV